LCDIIKTVQYKSETLTVGDETNKGKITKFELKEGLLYVWCNNGKGETWFNIELVKSNYNSKIPKVLKEKSTAKQITINIPVSMELKKKLTKEADKLGLNLASYCRIKLIK
jgi:hypothetical protein